MGLAYTWYSTPYYMYIAQAAGLEAVRRGACFLSTLICKIAGSIKKDPEFGNQPFDTSDVELGDENPLVVNSPRKVVIASWLFHLFLSASIIYDLVEYLPMTSNSPSGNPLNSWQRMVRFSLWFVNSHCIRNTLFLSMMAASHMLLRNDSPITEKEGADEMIRTRDYFGNFNFATIQAYSAMRAVSSIFSSLASLAALSFAVCMIFLLIVNILFGVPGNILYIWFGLIWVVSWVILLPIFKIVYGKFGQLDHFVPAHVIACAVFWAQLCMLVEITASFYRRKDYIGAINESYHCRDDYEIWKNAAHGGLWVRIFF